MYVRLYVTSRSPVKTAKYIITQNGYMDGSLGTLVF